MRIAIAAPLFESVPPHFYGGTERVVSFLTEELVERGHDVTLFASGDSQTKAKLQAISTRSLRLDSSCIDQLAWHMLLIDKVCRMAHEFDMINFHTDYLHFPTSRYLTVPHLTTLHGRLDISDIIPLHREFLDLPRVSISFAQRKPMNWANWVGNVYHGLPVDYYHYSSSHDQYLTFLGRLSPEKCAHRAIEIAVRLGIKLIIAAKVDKADQDYFDEVIKPLLNKPGIEYVGEISDREKDNLLGNAMALLFPIDWPEPFGLVMIESLACGTPVIAFRHGSVPEIIEHGKSGFIVDDIESAIEAVKNIDIIKRIDCRNSFEKRFSVNRMTDEYLNIYHLLTSEKKL